MYNEENTSLNRKQKKELQMLYANYYSQQDFFNIVTFGDSMLPEIQSGDIVTIKVVNTHEQLKVGDIIFYKNPILYTGNLFVVHRLVWIAGDEFIAKGDNCSITDPKMRVSNILGVVVDIQKCLANDE